MRSLFRFLEMLGPRVAACAREKAWGVGCLWVRLTSSVVKLYFFFGWFSLRKTKKFQLVY